MIAEKITKRGRKSYWPTSEAFISVGVRLPSSVHGALIERARANFRSMNAELTWILSRELDFKIGGKEGGLK